MGHIHDENTKRLSAYFDVPEDSYKCIKTNQKLMAGFLSQGREKRVFFTHGVPAGYFGDSIDLSRFADFSEAYQRLMFDITALNADSIDLVTDRNDGVRRIYISGGFARNELFVRTLAGFYPDKEVFTSQVDNSSALGAALMVWNVAFGNNIPGIDLGLKKWEAFSY
jgi:sugar (pentulose or hexulose) kinase